MVSARAALWLALLALSACGAPGDARGEQGRKAPRVGLAEYEGADAFLWRDGRIEVAEASFRLDQEDGVAGLEQWLAAWRAADEARTLEIRSQAKTPMEVVVRLMGVLERTGVEDFHIVRGER